MISGDAAALPGHVLRASLMKMYTATIKKEALETGSRVSYYTRQKLLFILLMTLVSVIPLAGISYFSFSYYKNSWIDKTSAELASLADSRTEIIEQFLASQNNQLQTLVDLNSPEYLGQQANLEKIFNSINRSGVITDLGLIDQSGVHRAYVGPFAQQLADKNYAQADWFLEVIRNGDFTSDIFTGYRGIPHFVIAIADPARDSVLRATVNSDMFNSLLAEAEVGPGGDAYILNRAGELQTPSRLGSPEMPGGDLAAGSPALYHTDDFIYAATSLRNGEWNLVLKEDINSSLAEFYSARNKAIVLIGLAVVLIITVATLLSSSLIDRIKEADQQRRQLNNRMQDVEKMALIGRLASSVSHEINNPLQIIESQAGWIGELLEDEKEGRVGDIGEYQDAVTKIRAHVRRARDITHRLLGFSKTGAEAPTEARINNLVRETVSFLKDDAEDNRIAIVSDLQKDMPLLVTYPSQLQQVFLNIMKNAIDAIGQDGTINIRTRTTSDDGANIEFADTGPGLGEGVQDRIFDSFFTTKQGRNTGLGLSISYNIIQRLGGDIEAKNREQGGSVFTITLPSGIGKNYLE